MRMSLSGLLLNGQPIEKVGVELLTTTNRPRRAPKARCLVPDTRRKWAPREFFNTLLHSRKFRIAPVLCSRASAEKAANAATSREALSMY
jgi:hypothetical protein